MTMGCVLEHREEINNVTVTGLKTQIIYTFHTGHPTKYTKVTCGLINRYFVVLVLGLGLGLCFFLL